MGTQFRGFNMMGILIDIRIHGYQIKHNITKIFCWNLKFVDWPTHGRNNEMSNEYKKISHYMTVYLNKYCIMLATVCL